MVLGSATRYMRAALGAVLFAACALPAAAQSAQEVRQDYKNWQLYCPAPPAGGKQDCEIHQLLKNKEGKLVAGMYGTRRSGNTLLMVRVPLGVLLNKKMTLQIDNGIGTDAITFLRCDVNGCIAQILASDAFLNSLRGGKSAKLTVFADTNRPIPIEFNLEGFADAEKALAARPG
ncbi:MAG: hypothetical protein GC201_02740 [Alphaproteobacteria bacterium]|nr:hypothetical protein [Alphaproteobacteria bacterium]